VPGQGGEVQQRVEPRVFPDVAPTQVVVGGGAQEFTRELKVAIAENLERNDPRTPPMVRHMAGVAEAQSVAPVMAVATLVADVLLVHDVVLSQPVSLIGTVGMLATRLPALEPNVPLTLMRSDSIAVLEVRVLIPPAVSVRLAALLAGLGRLADP
jgi:hypothetical protein